MASETIFVYVLVFAIAAVFYPLSILHLTHKSWFMAFVAFIVPSLIIALAVAAMTSTTA